MSSRRRHGKGTREEQLHELGDVIAWLASIANQLDLTFDEAVGRYTNGCPSCGADPVRVPGHDLTHQARPGERPSTGRSAHETYRCRDG